MSEGDTSAAIEAETAVFVPLPPPLRRKRGDLVTAALEGIPDTACAEVRFFCEYWRGLKGDAPLPTCEKLDPLDFFIYLSRVFILEGHTIDDLRVRLAGTVYRELYGFEVTGLRVGELIPFENRHDLLSGYDRCLRQQVPVYDVDKMTWRERGSEVCFERILLPFGEPQRTERILGFAQFFDSEGKKIFS
jgi:hypothetical protein